MSVIYREGQNSTASQSCPFYQSPSPIDALLAQLLNPLMTVDLNNEINPDPHYPSYSSNPSNISGNQHIIDQKNNEINQLNKTIENLKNNIKKLEEEILTLKGKINNPFDRLDV